MKYAKYKLIKNLISLYKDYFNYMIDEDFAYDKTYELITKFEKKTRKDEQKKIKYYKWHRDKRKKKDKETAQA